MVDDNQRTTDGRQRMYTCLKGEVKSNQMAKRRTNDGGINILKAYQ